MRRDRILRINKGYEKYVTAQRITLTIEMASHQKEELLYKWGEKLRPSHRKCYKDDRKIEYNHQKNNDHQPVKDSSYLSNSALKSFPLITWDSKKARSVRNNSSETVGGRDGEAKMEKKISN